LALAGLLACGIVTCACITVAALVRCYGRLEPGRDWSALAAMLVLLLVTLATQLRLLVLLGLAAVRLLRLPPIRTNGPERRWPGVSVVMPAYNEEENLEAGLRSLAELDYPELELLVVDDGSRDRTGEIARAFAARQGGGPQIRVIAKPNGGKWAALNLGIREASHPLVLCVDADSRISKNALRTLVPYLDEPDVGACCGQVRVRNRDGLLGRLQAVEYTVTGFFRASQDDCILLVPGPIGLFRKSALAEIVDAFGTPGFDEAHPGHCAGPFAADTFAEDCDLTLGLLTLGWRTIWDPRAIAFTRAPSTYPALLNQRYRWVRGTIQAFLKRPWRWARGARRPHRRLRAWLTGALAPDLFLMPPLSILSLFGLSLALSGALDFPWGVAVSVMTVDVVLASLAITVHDDDWRLLPSALLFGFFSTLLNVNWFPVMWDQFRGAKMRW
jgi:cellulose synthase/poly-beta-1,6-N-acetylglucosamine synthase-like glycosyltransferase